MALIHFAAHGDYKTHLNARIVFTEITGPWNIELVREWGLEAQPLFEALDRSTSNACVNVYRKSLLSTPESIEVHKRMIRKGVRDFGLRYVASVVDSSVEGCTLAKSILGKTYEDQLEHQIFKTIDDAYAWVKECIGQS